jgi:predicted DNA-binding protein YlxM (UPF0122 family)
MKFKYKVKGGKPKKRTLMTHKEVEQIFELYCDDLAVIRIAKRLNTTPRTVHRYIDYGDPKRDIEPLRVRRLRVFKKAAELKDASLAERIAENIDVAVKVFGESGRRLVERVAARRMLDSDSEVLTDDEKEAARRMAYEPTADDYAKFAKVCTDWVGVLGKTAEDVAQPINLSINQMQAQGQPNNEVVDAQEPSTSRLAREGVDAIYKHLEGMADATVADHNTIANVVADVSEGYELLED